MERKLLRSNLTSCPCSTHEDNVGTIAARAAVSARLSGTDRARSCIDNAELCTTQAPKRSLALLGEGRVTFHSAVSSVIILSTSVLEKLCWIKCSANAPAKLVKPACTRMPSALKHSSLLLPRNRVTPLTALSCCVLPKGWSAARRAAVGNSSAAHRA